MRQVGAPQSQACELMSYTVALTFKSVEVSELRVRGQPDDYALSTLKLDLEYSTGRVDRNVTVQIWHALGPLSGGVVRLITAVGDRDPICQPNIVRSIEHFYRHHACVEVEMLRFGLSAVAAVNPPANPELVWSTAVVPAPALPVA